MAEQIITLNPGESKIVSFEAVPHEVKTYQVKVNGLLGSFVAIALPPEPWEYSDIQCQVVPSGVGAWMGVRYSAIITNVGSSAASRTVTLYRRLYTYPYQIGEVWYGGTWANWRVMKIEEVTLAPGESYAFTGEPSILLIAYGNAMELYLEDSSGYRSAVCRANLLPR